MSPILVRPVREQLEHDRVIRLLQARYKKKFEVGINPGPSLAVPVGPAMAAVYPDVVLQAPERSRKLLGVIEVETGESVNHLEAMSQWAAFARLKVPFLLYVPAGSIDTARRLSADYKIPIAELWTYHTVGEEIRFTLIQRTQAAVTPRFVPTKPVAAAPRPPLAQVATSEPPVHTPAVKAVKPAPPVKTAVPAKPAVSARPAKPSAPAKPSVPVKAVSAAKPAVPARAVKPVTSAKAVKAVKPAKPGKPAKAVKVVKLVKATAKPAKASKVAKRVSAVKTTKPAAKTRAAARPPARKAAPPARRPAKSR